MDETEKARALEDAELIGHMQDAHDATNDASCGFCNGHGDIWTNWGGNKPVTCGHCHGTGRASSHKSSPDG